MIARDLVAIAVIALGLGTATAWSAPGAAALTSDTGYIGTRALRLAIDDCPKAPDVPPDKLRAIASEHYERGDVLYVQGDYPGAVAEFVDSYCLLPYYTVLKDIGQAYERSLDYASAIAYLRRYVAAVPLDAARTTGCEPDPQENKRNVSARIQVLAALPARILVETSPPNAAVTLTNSSGLTAGTTAGKELEARAGRYEMKIELPGYVPVTRPIEPEIGKPYTYFYRLEPQQGRLRVRATPAGTQLFLDKRFVGLSAYQDSLPGGTYQLVAEAPDHVSERRRIDILPNQDREISITLTAVPEVGHTQLTLYAVGAGAYAGGALSSLVTTPSGVGLSIFAGLVGGGIGVWRLAPSSVALGTSSLTITSSLIGTVVGAFGSGVFSTDANVRFSSSGAGLLVGAGLGYYLGDATRVSPGDAALINTGALWGSVAGGLFAQSFDPGARTSSGLVIAGLTMGTVSAGLLSRNFAISRKHAVLLDLSAVAGIISGFAIKGLVDSSTDNRRQANYGLGGLAVGLIAGALLTRDVDDPPVDKLQPALGTATSARGGTVPTLGLGATF
jgi:hypothetical protein